MGWRLPVSRVKVKPNYLVITHKFFSAANDANFHEWEKKNSCEFVKFVAKKLLKGHVPRCG
jgi:hypothetical protein